MRVLLATLVLVAPILAGCLAEGPTATVEPSSVAAVAAPRVPEGATLEAIDGGYRLSWTELPIPSRVEVEVPEGTVLVRAVGLLEDRPVYTFMWNEETGRIRCTPPFVVSWTEGPVGANACIGLAAVDLLPATWSVYLTGSVGMRGPGQRPLVGDLQVEFLSVPLQGPAAALDLAQLSMPAFGMTEREVVQVEGAGGAKLHAEVFRPKTDAKVPTILLSSPYNHGDRAGGGQPFGDVVEDWGPRGYAVVVADVRGTGESGGCVEVWSKAEQEDQKALVEWVAQQPWSDGKVGMYGVSYDGTTPVMAAVQAPEALKAIVSVAGVINAYDDWHFGGVPNVEGPGSPAGYTAGGVGAMVRPGDPLATVQNHANAVCDPTLAARANDPRAVYDAFYVERNFSARAQDVTAAVLYVQGFEDTNVKSQMATHWFNALPGPKLGLFGHWLHSHAPRADQELLMLAWFDEHLKGKDVGFDRVPPVSVQSSTLSHREDRTWPPVDAQDVVLHADFAADALANASAEGDAQVPVEPTGAASFAGPLAPGARVTLAAPLAQDLLLAGQARVDLRVSLAGLDNAYVAADLYDGDTLVTWGMFNLAHHEGHDKYAPLRPGQEVTVPLPLLPTEHLFAAGGEMRLVLRGAAVLDNGLLLPGRPGLLTFHGGEEGTRLVLPTVEPGEPAGPTLAWR